MRSITTSVHYVPPFHYMTTFTKAKIEFTDEPAHWCVTVELKVNDNPMSGSMFQCAFATKPTAKQVRQYKRQAISEYERDLSQFMADYPHCFR